jgi:alpha-glucuronidase
MKQRFNSLHYLLLLSFFSVFISHAQASLADFQGEDGYRLWLKYDLLANKTLRSQYYQQVAEIYLEDTSDTGQVIKQELSLALPALLGQDVHFSDKANQASLVVKLKPTLNIDPTNEGFTLQTHKGKITLSAENSVGLLYGTFHLLRLMQTEQSLAKLDINQTPKIKLRMLNHWDDLDRHTERGFAGESIFDWHKLPDYKEQRYYDYARANASIGINGIVPINVNSNALILSPAYLLKVQSLADIFRPYGIKVYLSIKFSSPQQLDDLSTSDPLDPLVQQWWNNKAAEIYKLIPDFGGFLVKANSEGQPGPGDYGRTHDIGANMLAKALKPYGGNVLWRAFVYAHDSEHERSLQAYTEFVPLDGKFEDNVSVQVKNGPIDFQPREPFSPLFGAMPKTSLAMEFQVTQEYLGFSTHLAYLGTMYKEVLEADTHTQGKGSTVAKIIDGSLSRAHLTVMAGVANIGADRNWTGHIFGQANWYVLGRLAWDHDLSAEQIAKEWVAMTLTHDPKASELIVAMMMQSRENIVNYMTPLGLHHLMDTGHHYGPGPWVDNLGRADWNPTYYHRADAFGIGLDRTSKGTNAVSQYSPYWQQRFEDPKQTPEQLLLWFHHLAWDYKMDSGKTLWVELVEHYYVGAAAVENMQEQWLALKDKIEPNQFNQVRMALAIQVKEAKWWRDACVLYFQTYSKMPIPAGLEAPKHSLEYYQSLKFPYAPGQG